MCGYDGSTIAGSPSGTTQLNPYRPVFTWDDPRLKKPDVVMSPGPQPTPNDPAYAAWKKKQDDQLGEYTMLMKRRAVLAAIYRMYPLAAKAAGRDSPFGGGPYKLMSGWRDGNGTSCTFTNPKVVREASGNPLLPGAYDIAPAPGWTDRDGVWHPAVKGHPAWVPYAPGKVPSVGDSYILTGAKASDGDKSFGRFLHVGIIAHVDVSADDVYWVTADGGQNEAYANGQAAHLVRRQFKCVTHMPSKPNAPHLSGGAEGGHRRVLGWLDIGDPRVDFDPKALQLPSLNDDYLKCGEWIDRARKG